MVDKADDSVHEQLAAAVLELDKLAPGSAAAFLAQARGLLLRAKMSPPKRPESHP